MSSLKAFKALDQSVRWELIKRLVFRKRRFLALQAGQWEPTGQTLLVGDRPAPSAPDDPAFHYTPFAALWHSSLWLNLQLERASIAEETLGWVNSADLQGRPTNQDVLRKDWGRVICLGGNAARWCRQAGVPHLQVHHPQAWKRFHPKEPYPLIQALTTIE